MRGCIKLILISNLFVCGVMFTCLMMSFMAGVH